jgi:hypothetical protein
MLKNHSKTTENYIFVITFKWTTTFLGLRRQTPQILDFHGPPARASRPHSIICPQFSG